MSFAHLHTPPIPPQSVVASREHLLSDRDAPPPAIAKKPAPKRSQILRALTLLELLRSPRTFKECMDETGLSRRVLRGFIKEIERVWGLDRVKVGAVTIYQLRASVLTPYVDSWKKPCKDGLSD